MITKGQKKHDVTQIHSTQLHQIHLPRVSAPAPEANNRSKEVQSGWFFRRSRMGEDGHPNRWWTSNRFFIRILIVGSCIVGSEHVSDSCCHHVRAALRRCASLGPNHKGRTIGLPQEKHPNTQNHHITIHRTHLGVWENFPKPISFALLKALHFTVPLGFK